MVKIFENFVFLVEIDCNMQILAFLGVLGRKLDRTADLLEFPEIFVFLSKMPENRQKSTISSIF